MQIHHAAGNARSVVVFVESDFEKGTSLSVMGRLWLKATLRIVAAAERKLQWLKERLEPLRSLHRGLVDGPAHLVVA